MSVYAHDSGSSGSVYAQSGATGGSVYSGKGGSAAPAKKGGSGGLFGFIGHAAHIVADKASLAAHDIKQIPGGLYQAGKALGHDVAVSVEHPGRQIGPTWGEVAQHPIGAFAAHPRGSEVAPLVAAAATSAKEAVQHPLRDPFQTAVTVLPVASVAARAAEAGAAAADAARVGSFGDAVKAMMTTPDVQPRLIQVGETKVPLQPSRAPLTRLAQKAHDKAIQNAISNNPEGRVAAYGMKRVGGSIAETQRVSQRLRDVPANLLDAAAKRLTTGPRVRVPGTTAAKLPRVEQAALELASVNTAPEDAAAFHLAQAEKGVAPGLNRAVAKLYQRVAAKGMLTKDASGNVVVDAKAFPKLAATDAQLSKIQAGGDKVLAKYGVRSAEVLKNRVNKPGRVRAGGTFDEKAGQIVGGESARPGRGFISYKGAEPRASTTKFAGTHGPVVGLRKSPLNSQEFKGTGIEQGLIPKNVTGSAARHYRSVIRFANTSDYRNAVLRTGSDVRRSSRDVLIRVPGETQKPFPANVEELIGRKHLTVDDEAGIQAALDAYRDNLLPGIREKFATDKRAGIGTPAPEGTKWIDQNVLGDLARPALGGKGRIARTADSLNSAVTAATVYFKLGHIGTRVLTNAATNIIQGSAAPLEMAKSLSLWKQLTHEDRLRALAAAGQHGFDAMPHEGQSFASRGATVGARWWAKHVDAPFRFNSLAFEARKAGFDTPASFRQMLTYAEDPGSHGLSAAQAAKVDWVVKRANREAIAYDRLSNFERQYITRAVWFYPWIRGASNFAANTLLEHPYKAGALGTAGVRGRETQQKALGNLTDYNGGLIPLGGNRVTDFSTFSPFATPSDVLDAVARPAELSGFLNPVYTAGSNLIFGRNQYGGTSTSPIKDAVTSLFSPTPEAQIIAALQSPNQAKKQFPTTPLGAFWRTLAGPAFPRTINLPAAHSAAARQKSGR